MRAYGFESTETLLDGASLSIGTAASARCLVGGDADPFADLRGISFVAFCPAVPAERVDVRARNADGEPVKIGWRTADSPDHVVLRAGPELYRFEVGAGETTGEAVTSADGNRFDAAGELLTDEFVGPPRYPSDPDDGDPVRCPRSPCLGEPGTKVDVVSGDIDADDAESPTAPECPDRLEM